MRELDGFKYAPKPNLTVCDKVLSLTYSKNSQHSKIELRLL